MNCHLKAVSYTLPKNKHTLAMLAEEQPDWNVAKIAAKTGIHARFIADANEYSLDLGIQAAQKLLERYPEERENIDSLIFCTQTPQYLIPTNACIIQNRLGLSTNTSAFDINLGCSGYVYALSVAQGLAVSNQAENILVITADTYTKLIAKDNRQLRTIFGDGASATLVKRDQRAGGIGRFCFYTDGGGADKLISRNSGLAGICSGRSYTPDLEMDGPDIFNFTLRCLPDLIAKTLEKNNLKKQEINYCIFHQANQYMLESLREKIGFSQEQCIIDLSDTGNTVSSTIPIILSRLFSKNLIQKNDLLLLVGFGVGLSCAATVLKYT